MNAVVTTVVDITAPDSAVEPRIVCRRQACLPGSVTASLTDAIPHELRRHAQISRDVGIA